MTHTNPYQPPESRDDTPRFMKGERFHVKCPHCKREFVSAASTSFLGFKKFVCFHCSEKFNYPLFRAYRVTYWTLLIAAGAYYMVSPTSGTPSFFILAMGFAVIADTYLLWSRK